MLKLGPTTSGTTLNVRTKDNSTYDDMVDALILLNRGKSGGYYWTFAPADSSDPNELGEQNRLKLLVESQNVVSSVIGDASVSVIGLYIGLVYTVGGVLRSMFDRYSERVIYEELPDTDKLRDIIEGIDIAQSEGDFETEKHLYNLLIAVYRDPQLMLKLTGVRSKYLPEPSQHNES